MLIDGDVSTVTESELVLLPSLLSFTLPSGSTVAVLDNAPAVVGVTANATLKDASAGIMTEPPLAAQVRLVPVIVQLIVPVGGVVPFVTMSAPCG